MREEGARDKNLKPVPFPMQWSMGMHFVSTNRAENPLDLKSHLWIYFRLLCNLVFCSIKQGIWSLVKVFTSFPLLNDGLKFSKMCPRKIKSEYRKPGQEKRNTVFLQLGFLSGRFGWGSSLLRLFFSEFWITGLNLEAHHAGSKSCKHKGLSDPWGWEHQRVDPSCLGSLHVHALLRMQWCRTSCQGGCGGNDEHVAVFTPSTSTDCTPTMCQLCVPAAPRQSPTPVFYQW